jgi:anthranilate synthase component 1
MIGLDPDLIWRCRDGRPEIARDAGLSDFVPDDRAPLDSLRALIAESAVGDDAQSAALPPMAAGLFGYLGYDMVRAMERLPEPNPDPLGVPDAILIRPRVMVVFDAVADALTVVTPVRPAAGVSARAALEAAQTRLDRVAEALEGPLPIEARADAASLALPSPVSNTEPEAFLGMVAKAKEYIVAGDIFQVVLSQRFEAPFTLPAFALYRSLRRTNPAPFLCYLDFEAFQVVCSSPEILVRVRDDKVTIRPIAGTRRRGATPAEDRALADELLADPKERRHIFLRSAGSERERQSFQPS